MYRTLAVGAAAAALCTFGLTAAASAAPRAASSDAHAAPCSPDFYGTGVRIHSAASVGAPVLGEGNAGDCLTDHSGTVVGEHVTCDDGRVLNQWMDVTDLRTGVRGWISGCGYVT